MYVTVIYSWHLFFLQAVESKGENPDECVFEGSTSASTKADTSQSMYCSQSLHLFVIVYCTVYWYLIFVLLFCFPVALLQQLVYYEITRFFSILSLATIQILQQFMIYSIFTHESSYCFQRILAIAIPFVYPSVCLSHRWISQKRCNQSHQIFTIGCLEDSSFRNRKAFP